MSRRGATHGRSPPGSRRPCGLGERGPPTPVSTEKKLIRLMSAGPQYGGRQEKPVLVRVADVPKQGQAPGVLAEVGPAMVVGLAARRHGGTAAPLHRCDVASGNVVRFGQLPGQAPARCGFPHRKPVVSPGTFTAAAAPICALPTGGGQLPDHASRRSAGCGRTLPPARTSPGMLWARCCGRPNGGGPHALLAR